MFHEHLELVKNVRNEFNLGITEVAQIYLEKPHTINKNLYSGIKVRELEICFDSSNYILFIENMIKVQKMEHNNLEELFSSLNLTKSKDLQKSFITKSHLILRKLIPKYQHLKDLYEVVLKGLTFAIFIPLNEDKIAFSTITPDFIYALNIENNEIQLWCEKDKNHLWLTSVFFEKVLHFSVEKRMETKNSISSLRLIDQELYFNTYKYLKTKYADFFLKTWTECTDPEKYIFEDLAIAAYLLVLWKSAKNSLPIKFIDLGCGNGLLTCILHSEGYVGYGIDMKKRKIWNIYTNSSYFLKVMTIHADSIEFNSVNWIIGNHSDELTPWIPIIALKSSRSTNFFILPCCAFDFYGKYQRRNAGISTYFEYLTYLRNISESCGFLVKEDKLRIPSTKRYCLIGEQQISSDNLWHEMIKKMQNLIKQTKSNFVPRSISCCVRNGTQLPLSFLEKVVQLCAFHLLSFPEYCCVTIHGETKKWNAGTSLPLSTLIKLFEKEQLQTMKNECGGLQTLLKNHSHIFVVKKGIVKLRMPEALKLDELDSNSKKYKCWNKRPCWFHEHHPDGCVLTEELCSFRHNL